MWTPRNLSVCPDIDDVSYPVVARAIVDIGPFALGTCGTVRVNGVAVDEMGGNPVSLSSSGVWSQPPKMRKGHLVCLMSSPTSCMVLFLCSSWCGPGGRYRTISRMSLPVVLMYLPVQYLRFGSVMYPFMLSAAPREADAHFWLTPTKHPPLRPRRLSYDGQAVLCEVRYPLLFQLCWLCLAVSSRDGFPWHP